MRTPIVFPTESQRFERDVAEFQGLTFDQRVQALLDLSRLCEDLRKASPTGDLQLQLLEERERVENDLWRELLHRHG